VLATAMLQLDGVRHRSADGGSPSHRSSVWLAAAQHLDASHSQQLDGWAAAQHSDGAK
jgi:hypothetical protein